MKNTKKGNELTLEYLVSFLEKNSIFIDGAEILDPCSETDSIKKGTFGQKNNILLGTNQRIIFGSLDVKRVGISSNGFNQPLTVTPSRTFFASLVAIFFPQINIIDEFNQAIDCLINKLKSTIRSTFRDFGYLDLGWVQREFIERFSKEMIGHDIIRYTADVFHINVVIIDIEKDTVRYHGYPSFVPYKRTVFLATFQNIFEPILFDGSPFSNNAIKCLMDNHYLIEYVDNNLKGHTNPRFVVEQENLDRYITPDIAKKILIQSDLSNQSNETEQKQKQKQKQNIDDLNDHDNNDYQNDQDFQNNQNFQNNQDYQNDQDDQQTTIHTTTTTTPTIPTAAVNVAVEATATNITKIIPETPKQKVNNKMKITDLQDLAAKYGIATDFVKNDKKYKMTKQMLIDEINDFVEKSQTK